MIIEEIKDRDDLYHLNLTALQVLVLGRCVEVIKFISVFPCKYESELDILSRAFSDFSAQLDLPF